jgi:hypothetical protein
VSNRGQHGVLEKKAPTDQSSSQGQWGQKSTRRDLDSPSADNLPRPTWIPQQKSGASVTPHFLG